MKRFFTLSLLTLLILSSCVAPGGDASRFVPEDAYAAVLADSPVSLYQKTQAFIRSSGLEQRLEGASLQDKLKEWMGTEENAKEISQIVNPGKPLALVILPYKGRGQVEASAVVWLPLKGEKDAFDRLVKTLKDGTASRVDGYAVVALKGKPPSALPSHTADLSRLSRYPADSIKAWVNVEALRRDFPKNWKEAMEGAFKSVPPEESSPENANEPFNYNELNFDWEQYYEDQYGGGAPSTASGMGRDLKGFVDKMADEVKTLDFALIADEKGAHVRAGATVKEDGLLGKLASNQKASKLPYLKYVESDALFGGAWSYDSALNADFMREYYKALGMGSLLEETYFELSKSSYASQGSDGAFSLSAAVNPDFLAKAGGAQTPEDAAKLVQETFSIDFSEVSSLKDVELYRRTLRSLTDPKIWSDTFSESLAGMGLELGFNMESGTSGGLEYDVLKITMGGPQVESQAMTKAIMDTIFDKLTVYAGYKQGRVYMALGTMSGLEEAAKRDKAISPLTEDTAYKVFSADLPKNTRGVYYLSFRRLFQLISAFTPNETSIDPEKLDRLFAYYATEQGSMEIGLFIRAQDVKALLELDKSSPPL